jgi:hypothetical protein
MTTKLPIFGVFILSMVLSGCVTPPGPSVAKLGAGSDAANVNANRGRADAQISSAQAAQYSRQREQVSEEMKLEQQKRKNTMDNVKGFFDVCGSVLNAASKIH